MNRLAERLLTGTVIWRLALWLLLIILPASVLWLSLIAPLLQQQAQLRVDTALLRQQYQQLSGQLHKYNVASSPVLTSAPSPLPVLDLVQTSGMTLIRWQPAQDLSQRQTSQQPSLQKQTVTGKAPSSLNELVLHGGWSQLPALFDLLADYQALPQAFSVTAQADYLQIKLYLDIDHGG